MNKVVVTRHKALVKYLKDKGLIDKDTIVIEHATADDVKGKDVIGVLPMGLAALAESVTVVDMDVPADKRGKELDLEDIYLYVTGIRKYKVEMIEEILDNVIEF